MGALGTDERKAEAGVTVYSGSESYNPRIEG
jgi:hypothetical protein